MVKITGNGITQTAFEPNVLILRSGGALRVIHVSGKPDTIAFYPDSGYCATHRSG